MEFTKMHGAGNDYVYVNGFKYSPANLSQLAIEVSDRHFGIGSDGLVMILPSATCDFAMRMFNADGSEAEMCGNATRCIGKYVYEHGMTTKTNLTLETKAGVKHLQLHLTGDKVTTVTVDMGEPCLEPALIPVVATDEPVMNLPIEVGGETFYATCVSMGNPHAVIFMDDPECCDLHAIGRAIEVHPLFPRHTNVEFIKVISRECMHMRVWERGTGETLACGTGACAALVAAVLNGYTNRGAMLRLIGGDLFIEWDNASNRVFMTGPATTVFEGNWIEQQ